LQLNLYRVTVAKNAIARLVPEAYRTPPSQGKPRKFWYEQAIRIPHYAIYEVEKASVEVYGLVGNTITASCQLKQMVTKLPGVR
jgi:hypothetical protein